MTRLQVRRVPFDFRGEIPFLWNRESPEFSLQMNATSIMAIAFERYIAVAMKEALPRIADDALAAEADAFLKQEAQHCRAHQQHVRALARSWPGLSQTVEQAIARYDDLLARKPLEYHLAYIADLESAFTPTFKLFLDHEDRLFRPGDERVASLFLWHFTEEVEHRSSGLLIYRAFGSEGYRLRVLPSVIRHILGVLRVVALGMNEHVPFEDRGVDARVLLPSVGIRRRLGQKLPLLYRLLAGGYPAEAATDFIPAEERRAAGRRILRAQLPSHDPEDQPLPAFVDSWLERYAAGGEVSRWYSSHSGD